MRERLESGSSGSGPPPVVVIGTNQILVAGVIGLLREAGIDSSGRTELQIDPGERQQRARTATPALVVALDDAQGSILTLLSVVRTGSPIILVTNTTLESDGLATALQANVMWVLAPSIGIAGLELAVQAVREGRTNWSVANLMKATDGLRSQQPRRLVPTVRITPREEQVIDRMRAGSSIKEIAIELAITPKTVEAIQRGLYGKLGVRNRIEALEQLKQRSRVS